MRIKTRLFRILFFLCLTVAAFNAAGEESRAPAGSNKACAICHIDWMPDFYEDGVRPLVPLESYVTVDTGKQIIASTKRMCFTCHDGFINDSRSQFVEGAHMHPVGIKPSNKIHIKKTSEGVVYPLNEDGKMYCGTCHTAHGNDWNKGESALFMRSKNVNSSLCIDCHADNASKSKNNHPMAKHKGHLPDSLNVAETRSKLGVNGEVICQTCHRSHRANKNLLVFDNSKSKVCTACHENKKKILGTKHDLTKHKYKVINAKGQKVDENGTCSGCHINHGGFSKPLLATAQTAGNNDVWAQCMACHSKGGIAGEVTTGKFSHPVDVPVENIDIEVLQGEWKVRATKQKLISMPLFDSTGRSVDHGGNVQCPTCHDVHSASEHNKSFLRTQQSNSSDLCVNCHVNQARIKNSKHNIGLFDSEKLAKISVKMDKNKGVCYTCHQAHNGKFPNMLTMVDKIEEKSTSLIGTLCMQCHSKNGAASDSLIGGQEHSHPISIGLPKGMTSGKLPLFTTWGKRVKAHETGRIDCATCHNVHQWDADDPDSTQARDLTAKAHRGNSFLRLTADKDSNLCTSCHERQAQIIDTDHDMRLSAKWLKTNDKSLDQEGVCSQCHAAHKSKSAKMLWSRSLGVGDDLQTSFCRSCHDKEKITTNKIVPNGAHPPNVLVWSTPRRIIPNVDTPQSIPVFTKDGKRTDMGIISCPSCHDPHQWQGSKIGKGAGKDQEGNSVNSFLRKKSLGHIVCADCHGLDALFRYQYFHSKTNTKDHPLYID